VEFPTFSRVPGVKRLIASLAILASCAVLAAEDGSWMALEQGKIFYSQKKFGEALQVLNKAISDRNANFTEYSGILDSVLKGKQAKSAGDSMSKLLSYYCREDLRKGDIARIEEESGGSLLKKLAAYEKFRISDGFQNFIDVLQACLGLRTQEYFGDSIETLKAFVARRRYFPEAEYWIAKVFLADGEYEIAQKQLEKALGYSDSLDMPDFAFEIRYLMADIHKTEKNLAAMEADYKALLGNDGLYVDDSQRSLREAMKRILMADGISKFMVLYRHDAYFAAKAYADLGEYYYKSGRYGQAIDHLMLAVCILSTKEITAIMQDDLDYRFSSIQELLGRIDSTESLSAFAEESGYRRALYYLGTSLAGEGRPVQAKEVFRGLAGSKGTWATLAAAQLRRPFLDRATADPEF
jgi:tetratricopeptide (TPR) repeat protein